MKRNNFNFNTSWMYYLRNSGFPAMYILVFVTLESYTDKVDDEYFNSKVNELAKLLSKVEEIKYHSRKHETTVILEAYRQTRLRYVSEIRAKLKTFKNSVYQDQSVPGTFLFDWFESRAPQLMTSAQFEISGFIATISNDLSNNIEVIEAIEALGIDNLFNDLIETEGLYLELFYKRGVAWAENKDPMIDTLSIRQEAIWEIQSVFQFIKEKIRKGDVMFAEVMGALQKNLEPLRITVKRRQTAKKSEINSENPSDVITRYIANGSYDKENFTMPMEESIKDEKIA